MTYADAHAQAEREWDDMTRYAQINAIDADDDGLSGYVAWGQALPMSERAALRSTITHYLRQHPRCDAWLDRRALAIQEEAEGRDDNDAAYDAAKGA